MNAPISQELKDLVQREVKKLWQVRKTLPEIREHVLTNVRNAHVIEKPGNL